MKYSYCYCGSENFPVDESLNVLKDALENVYAIFQDTSEDFYVDEFLNILLDAFENVYAIVPNTFKNFSVDKNMFLRIFMLISMGTSNFLYIDLYDSLSWGRVDGPRVSFKKSLLLVIQKW